MVPQPRKGTFSSYPAAPPLHTGITQSSSHPSHAAGALSAGASPSNSSPTGSNSLTKIAVTQIYLLLSTLKEDQTDPRKWESQKESLRKLIDEHGMEAFNKYFARLVVANAYTIFHGAQRPAQTPNSQYALLLEEMDKLTQDFSQARKVAEAIETGAEDIFRDFDLSTFMEHFQLDALEKTLLALGFKLGSRPDLKTKADAILSTNFPTFVNILSRSNGDHAKLDPDFIAELIDRFIQVHPPNFNAAAKQELQAKALLRYKLEEGPPPPSQVLAALDLVRVLADRPFNALALYIHRSGVAFTNDEETCTSYIQNRPSNIQLSEEQVSAALMYATISQTPSHNPSVLVAALRRVLPESFRWQDVVSYFDHPGVRITPSQFLRLYNALLPIAHGDPSRFEIQRLWGGEWDNAETQLSFICAFASLKPEQLDATTIPGLKPTFALQEYAKSHQSIQEYAAYAVKHPLVSEAALSAVFNVALHSIHASQSIEARRLFQNVVINNLGIFIVSAFGVPKPWPTMALETLGSLFERFLVRSPETDFVMDSIWRRDKEWVKQRLIDTHGLKPIILPSIFEHAVRQNWLEELVYLPNAFGLDLTAMAHAEGYLDLQQWARRIDRTAEMARLLLQFLMVKSNLEMAYQRPPDGGLPVKTTTSLQVKTVSALLQIVEEFYPKSPVPELILVQRTCITAYPRLINYGEGFDDIIDANGRESNALPQLAIEKMEEHYKRMYGDEMQVRNIVEVLDRYKHSRDPLEQDVFACMIHGLFDEYTHYSDYPLEALATTAVLFGGIISHKLVSDLPLQIGLGMILEAVRDHHPDNSMYKFGLQALMQLFSRLREWPGFCSQLLQIPGLQGTEAYKKAEDVVREHDEEMARSRNGVGVAHAGLRGASEKLTNGGLEDNLSPEQHAPPFTSINPDFPSANIAYEEPNPDAQGKIQFALNNVTEGSLQAMFTELSKLLDAKYQQWFASHLVEERAKMQPNYHKVYLELVQQFQDKNLWSEVLRETYVSVQRMLNSEATLTNTTDRTHLKNLGGWLGLLTLARDKPIRHKNIAFRQLLIEAHDTKRLIVVIPFVCKVLIQGADSNIFRPPNPWLMDIINLLIELYHNAELKLNLKFEIEVLCKGLKLDHKAIKPSGEILNRAPIEDVTDRDGPELDAFDGLSINGMPGVNSSLTAHPAPAIPDLGPNLTVPPTEVVSASKLHSVIREALTRALQDIIQPVVDRSVTIAAISTHQMIKKDFATEPDEKKMRTAAINMVKSTAGNLALVTSKEPLRANFMNYLRNLSSELPQGLPEGIIMLCVNSNLEMASNIIEQSAEERAVPEIEELLLEDLEARRIHRATRPNENFIDPVLTRWAMTIPAPFKLQPSPGGLNAEQMAIYDDFARQSRANAAAAAAASATPSHVPSVSDARSLANEVLGDQYSAVPGIPTPAETPSLPHMGVQLQHYPQAHGGMTNGRQAGVNHADTQNVAQRVGKLLDQLHTATANAPEEHFAELPRAHPVLDIIDALQQLIIKTQQTSEDFVSYAANQIAQVLLRKSSESSLLLESLVNVLENLRKVAGPQTSDQIRHMFLSQSGDTFLNIPLLTALRDSDLLNWRVIDAAMAAVLEERKEGSLEFFEQLMDLVLLNDQQLALYADFVQSLAVAWTWISEDPEMPAGKRLQSKLNPSAPEISANSTPDEIKAFKRHQMEYVFDEWIHLHSNPLASERSAVVFMQQMQAHGVVHSKDDFFTFCRYAIEKSVDYHEQASLDFEPFLGVDALVSMMILFGQAHDNFKTRLEFLDSILSLGVLVLNDHHVKRGQSFNGVVFFRLFSNIFHGVDDLLEGLPEADYDKVSSVLAKRLWDLRPELLPGFLFQWVGLLGHPRFLPTLLRLPNDAGWAPYTKLLAHLLSYLGDMLKSFEVSILGKELYSGTLKLLAVLHHDFPGYLSANHVQLCQCLPSHAAQLINMILSASPAPFDKMTDPFHPGLKIDRIPEMRKSSPSSYNFASQLREIGLYDILEQSLQNGPSEDGIAQITHVISQPDGNVSTFGHIPVTVNRRIIDAVVAHIAHSVVQRVTAKPDAPLFVSGAPDNKTLIMLITEVSPEARYYLLSSIVNELRFASVPMNFFCHAIVEMFGQDVTDPEELDIDQQIVRILLERLVGYWPQPWGLMITTLELIKNEKYQFFDLPFIKATPDIAERFMTVLRAATVSSRELAPGRELAQPLSAH